MSGKHDSETVGDHHLLDAVLEDVLASVHVDGRERGVEHDHVMLRVARACERDTLRERMCVSRCVYVCAESGTHVRTQICMHVCMYACMYMHTCFCPPDKLPPLSPIQVMSPSLKSLKSVSREHAKHTCSSTSFHDQALPAVKKQQNEPTECIKKSPNAG